MPSKKLTVRKKTLLGLGLTLLSAGAIAVTVVFFAQISQAEGPFTCKISTDRRVYKIGEVPKIVVSIENHGFREVELVRSLDASDCGWRYPHCTFEILRADGTSAVKGIGRCGNTNALRPEDFTTVDGRTTFNPLGEGSFGGHQLGQTTFDKPGVYAIRFKYSTKSEKIEEWLGDGRWLWEKGQRDETLAELFEKTPKIDLWSNVLEVSFE